MFAGRYQQEWGRAKGEGEGRLIWLKYFMHKYENRIMKPVEIILWCVGEDEREDWGGDFDQDVLYACVEVAK
jgi:hypothetical protein